MPKVTFIIDGESRTVEFEYGSLPCSNSTVFDSPSMMNVTFGMFVFS